MPTKFWLIPLVDVDDYITEKKQFWRKENYPFPIICETKTLICPPINQVQIYGVV
jgi:hypothetical protein